MNLHPYLFMAVWAVQPPTAAPFNFGPPTVRESAAEQAANLNRSRNKLTSLQQSARQCSGMRLLLVHSAAARMRRPVEMARLNPAETEKMKALISRMEAVKEAPAALPNAELIVRLELLGQGDTVLDSVEYLDVVSESLVNEQGYAAGARLLLRGGDSTAWHLLMRAEHARSIAANPAPGRQRNRPIRFASIPEPPRPVKSEDSDPFPDNGKEEYYHKY